MQLTLSPLQHAHPRLQVDYDRYGLFVTVGTICVGPTNQTLGPTRIYAFDKLGLAGTRRITHGTYWDVTNGLGDIGAQIAAVMPARPQGRNEANRDCVFFAAQVGVRRGRGARGDAARAPRALTRQPWVRTLAQRRTLPHGAANNRAYTAASASTATHPARCWAGGARPHPAPSPTIPAPARTPQRLPAATHPMLCWASASSPSRARPTCWTCQRAAATRRRRASPTWQRAWSTSEGTRAPARKGGKGWI